MAYLTLQDLELLWRPLQSDERQRAEELIAIAEELLLAQWPIATWITAGHVTTGLVRWAVSQMVREVIEQTGTSQPIKYEQLGAGPFSRGINYSEPKEHMSIPWAVYKRFSDLAEKLQPKARVYQAWMA